MLAWFDATHELTNADGRLWYRRTGLPGPGSVGEQDHRLLSAIEMLQTIHNIIVNNRNA